MSRRTAVLLAAALGILLAAAVILCCRQEAPGEEAAAAEPLLDCAPRIAPQGTEFFTVKDTAARFLLNRQSPDGVYQKDGWLAKEEAALQPAMLDHAGEIFQSVYDTYLAGTGSPCYFALVPGKHCFLGEGRPSLDYGRLAEEMAARTPFCTQLDLTPFLSLEDYYRTDSHWRQEKILDAARYLGEAMGAHVTARYTTETLDRDFTGVYLEQLNLPLPPEKLHYLTSPTLQHCLVNCYDLSGEPRRTALYNLAKAHQYYPYDLFLSGAEGLVTVRNLRAETDRELILFRDSFGSSLAPLLVEGYAQITLVDLRYFPSALLGDYLDFHGQDVLFLYSSLLLNNSLTLR